MRTKLNLALIVLGLLPVAAHSDTVLETATLGPSSESGGWSVSHLQLLGARFFVEETTEVTHVGAHLSGKGRMFATIASLEDPEGFPEGPPFRSWNVVASTTFDAPESGDDLLLALPATLEPGHYAVVFGSGQLGAEFGSGGMSWVGQKNLFGASFIVWHSGQWHDAETLGIRFRVVGHPPCPADIDGSDDVGLSDLLVLLSAWGPCPKACLADLNGDEIVDFEDLLLLLGAWGPC